MTECDYCQHVEMCRWLKDVEEQGCEFFDDGNKWIPVSERLPEDGTWSLFTDGKTVSVERYKADAIDHFFPEGRFFPFDLAIAWMPLPEPYKAERIEE